MLENIRENHTICHVHVHRLYWQTVRGDTLERCPTKVIRLKGKFNGLVEADLTQQMQ